MKAKLNRSKTFFALTLLFLAGCAAIPKPADEVAISSIDISRINVDPAIEITPISELTRLSDTEAASFLSFLADPMFSATPRHVRVASYLSQIVDQFEYSENTYTASETLAKMSGNCLSLSLLTTAYAKLAGVGIDFQLLERNPVYSVRSNVLIESDHLRAVLRHAKARDSKALFELEQRITIDFFDSSGFYYRDNISVEDQFSLYYSNRAAELMTAGQNSQALAFAYRALELSTKNFSALNTAAIVHTRNGDLETAESFYRSGLGSLRGDLFLRNYVKMLSQQGRNDEALRLLNEHKETLKSSPGYWLARAKDDERTNQAESAIANYKKALELAPNLHQIHYWISLISQQVGDFEHSKHHLQKAITLSETNSDRKRYKFKYSKL